MSKATLPEADPLDELPAEVWDHGTGRALHAIDDDGSALCDISWSREPRRVDPRHLRGFRELCGYCFSKKVRDEYEDGG